MVYRGFTGAGGHRGLDISGPVGSTIVASDSGTVVVSGWHDVTERSYGYYIKIDHGNGIATLYAHCSQLLVSAGEPVVAGQPIALMGSTGNSTGPHLHFEVLVSGSPVDPYGFVTKPG